MNRLQHEKSPYLLQHASNPVDWYPWSEEAFQTAERENKPVFLSIGYSTCHWCHVMEKESFEDGDVASLLNREFICIKVDREERPDIDSVYMTVCQAMTGRGGWPLSIFMTPDKEPFLAATYIPRENRFGAVGMKVLVPRLAEVWKTKRTDLLDEAGRIRKALKELTVHKGGNMPSGDVLTRAFEQLRKSYDQEFGGFSGRPKFPAPHNLMFLLRYGKTNGRDEAIGMVNSTLRRMRHGGIFDQIGGGFHRYSTDEKWLLPHFEKMLYDQAMLIMTYCEAFQVSGDGDFADTVHRTVRFLKRDMISRNGAFYSGWDADSEGEEGKFYVWKKSEIIEALGGRDGERYCDIYNIKDEGNYEDESTGHLTGSNIPFLAKRPALIAKEIGMSPESIEAFIKKSNDVLLTKRNTRVFPHVDDKVLTDWNGLTIAALALASKVLGEEEYLTMAEDAYRFIIEHLVSGDGQLLHRWRDGEGAIHGFLDDYSFLIFGLLELYEASFDPAYLRDAITFSDGMIRLFSSDSGGYYFTPEGAETVLVRNKEIYDAAYPSGNSVAALVLLRLSRYTGNPRYEERAEDIFKAFSGSVSQAPIAHTFMMSALGFALGKTSEIVVTGEENSVDTVRMIGRIREVFAPGAVVLFKPSDRPSEISELVPFVKNLEPVDGRTTAFVCRDHTCSMPLTDPDEVIKLL